jgi:hypothetical protein
MRPTPWTYALAALVLASMAVMYVLSFVLGAQPLPLIAVIAVAAFAVVGTAFGVAALPGGPLDHLAAGAAYSGAFVGGSSVQRMPTALWLGLSGLLYGAFMLHVEGPLSGHVGVIGATGTTAAVAVLGVRVSWVAAGRPRRGGHARRQAPAAP